MAQRLLKETRDLLPMFLIGALVILLPCLVWPGPEESPGAFFFAICCAVLGGSSFGGEFQQRTLPLLLSQPVSRSEMWRDKMLVLGGFLAASFVIIALCVAAHVGRGLDGEGMVLLFFVMLCAFCGAPFWTLQCRRGIAGMVFSMVAPGGLAALAALVCEYWLPLKPEVLIPPLIALYCILVLALGYRKFLGLQIVDGGSEEQVRVPFFEMFEKVFERSLKALTGSSPGPLGNLVQKELRFQQMPLLMAVLFVFFAVIGGALYWRRRELAGFIVAVDCLVYLTLLPLLPGALAFAEEKALGVADWHMSLPLTTRGQWALKMVVALGVSFGLGLLLPAAIWQIGRAILEPNRASAFPPARAVVFIILLQLLLTSLAAYCATFTESTLKAILGAFGSVLTVALCIYATLRLLSNLFPGMAEIDLFRNPGCWALWCIGLAMTSALIQFLSFRNYRRRTVGWLSISCQAVEIAWMASALTAIVVLAQAFLR